MYLYYLKSDQHFIIVNFCIMPEPASISKTLSSLEQKGVTRAAEFLRIGSAYALEHATKPSTIGIVLSSSPIALLAWCRHFA